MIGMHHVLSSFIISKCFSSSSWYQQNNKEKLNLVLLIGSIAPDFDFIFEIIKLEEFWHKTITHSFSFLFLLIVLYSLFSILYKIKQFNAYFIFFLIGFIIHLFLDFIVWWWIYLYWLSNDFNLKLQLESLSNWYQIPNIILYISLFILWITLILRKEKSILFLLFVSLATLADLVYFWLL